MFAAEYDLILQAFRVLFLLALPVVVVVSVAGTLAAALQSATTIQDPALGYAVRLIALIAVLYLMTQGVIDALLTLAQMAFR